MTYDTNHPVFHHGELAAQKRDGLPDFAERVRQSGFVRPFMPDQHREFFKNLPMVATGLLDKSGRPWATMLIGELGFLRSPEPNILSSVSRPVLSEALGLQVHAGSKVGLCGVEVETRRRNRMNGTVVNYADSTFAIRVDQSFGNCPQYIQKRKLKWSEVPTEAREPKNYERTSSLSPSAKELIELADTFFIASRAPEMSDDPRGGIDASHRGGKPGFINVSDDNTLSFPDFSGNRFYNTVGNIELDERIGLFIPNLSTGDAVMITGRAAVCWEDERIAAFEGAERIIDVIVDESIYIPALLPIQGTLIEPWPVLEATGSWQQVSSSLLKKDGYRTFKITRIQRESSVISSFYLSPVDGGALEPYTPGQFLPIRLNRDKQESLSRSYTLSQALDKNNKSSHYRLSIKREGQASRLFHDDLTLGSRFEAGSPTGDFVLDDSDDPIVMLSAGVGITPMIAMLDGLIKSGKQTESPRKVWFIHGTLNSETHAFAGFIQEQQQAHPWLTIYNCFSKPLATDVIGEHYDAKGRVTIDTLKALLPFDKYQFYLCGPEGFMHNLYDGLRDTGIGQSNIHYEFFGEGTLGESEGKNQQATEPVGAVVEFSQADIKTSWGATNISLLELAESQGLTPPQNCRSGKCGTCATKLLAGSVYYPNKPVVQPAEGQVLICCCQPSSADEKIVLEL